MAAQKKTTEVMRESAWNCSWDTISVPASETGDRQRYRQRGGTEGPWKMGCFVTVSQAGNLKNSALSMGGGAFSKGAPVSRLEKSKERYHSRKEKLCKYSGIQAILSKPKGSLVVHVFTQSRNNSHMSPAEET